MALECMLAFFIIRYLRKFSEGEGILPQWNMLFIAGMVVSGVLFMAAATLPQAAKHVITWLITALLLYFAWLVYTQKDFIKLRSMVFAVLPLVIITFINDVVKTVSKSFYEEWDKYFSTAELFAVVWMFAMWFITRKQRKALELERRKAKEKEEQYLLTESVKKELEVQVAERTASLTKQTRELQQTLEELKATQTQLVHAEKMASLGELTAGIAHEIQNPLNFVNNFSEVNTELIAEMNAAISRGDMEEVKAIAADISGNEEKISFHGKRADAIVKGMLQHSRSSSGQKEPTDINALADEYLRLAYHGLRAKDKTFNAAMETNFDESIGKINIIPQDIGRVILNLITNAFYAVNERYKAEGLKPKDDGEVFKPRVTVSTRKEENKVCVAVKDNGSGIPQQALDKIFQPFFTTKPTGEGTGLGLSMSFDIVTKGHGGEIKVNTKANEGTEFIVELPLQ